MPTYYYSTLVDPQLSGVTYFIASGINNAGQIVGYYLDSGNVFHGFEYSSGNFTPIDDPSASTNTNDGTLPVTINNNGQIVGAYFAGGHLAYGFLTPVAHSLRSGLLSHWVSTMPARLWAISEKALLALN